MRAFGETQMWHDRAAYQLPVIPNSSEIMFPADRVLITADGAMIDQLHPSASGDGLSLGNGTYGMLYAAGRP
jgi:hypothetical protein